MRVPGVEGRHHILGEEEEEEEEEEEAEEAEEAEEDAAGWEEQKQGNGKSWEHGQEKGCETQEQEQAEKHVFNL